ncbi:hypothetical protein LUZ61_016874 [Rhynchospora tenuis]|uniref:GRAS family transcription factor n=1 Tax=Rhynchospora tenuis TaxID=198213 RepID=A0AAD5Z6D3_9POAL|nr:hypothetical protein LUZ61_016874 [Rhynchospora tenuis]
MASHFNSDDLSDMMINTTQHDNSAEQNASCSKKVNGLQPLCTRNQEATKTFSERVLVSNVPRRDDGKLRSDAGDHVTSSMPISYITHLLLEEDINEQICSNEEDQLALLATEKAFRDTLTQEYYSSPDEPLIYGSPIEKESKYYKSKACGRSEFTENNFNHEVPFYKATLTSDDPTSELCIGIESLTAQQIQKGEEEAMKFLPKVSEFFINSDSSGISFLQEIQKEECSTKMNLDDLKLKAKTKKNIISADLDQADRRAQKQLGGYSEEPIRNETFDEILLLEGPEYNKKSTMSRADMKKEMRDKSQKREARPKFATISDTSQASKEFVNLKSLLIQCSEAVASNDHSLAIELINEIRKHSSPIGDCSQRLAYYFVDGLEARLAGTTIETHRRVLPEKTTVIETLKAFHMYIVASPFIRALIYFSNQSILNNIPKDAQKVHIINYGIIQGFQWPSFFQHFTKWQSTPPKIRITIIEVPEPGFRPRKRVEVIGKRLADYAKSFGVPFEYEGIASKWENVGVEDLKIANDEVVIVNSVVRSEYLSDETLTADSPRNIFLRTIKKIKPRIFVHGTINGSYNSPFFLSRFRFALLHFSSLFDMLDSTLPRDNPERQIIEKEYFMRAAINAIACEGPDRVERPETYRQWHARKLRAGLVPLPVDPMVKKNMKDFVRDHYHEEFVIDDDNGWLLLAWKGRIFYGLTTWKASEV